MQKPAFIFYFLLSDKFNMVRSYLMLVLSALMASFFALTFRQLSTQAGSVNAVILLYLFATVLSAPGFIWEKSWKKSISKPAWLFIGLICISSIMGNYFNSIALQYINPSASQMIQRTDIFFGFAYGIIFFKNKIRFSIVIGVLLCVLGLSIMYQDFFRAQIPLIAMSAGVLTAFSFATMQFCTKIIIKEVSPNTINFWRLLISSFFLMVVLFNNKLELTLQITLLAALAAFLGPFAVRLLINHAVKHAPFAAINLFLSLSPVFTLGLQYIFLNITASTNELIGSALVMTASVSVGLYYRG